MIHSGTSSMPEDVSPAELTAGQPSAPINPVHAHVRDILQNAPLDDATRASSEAACPCSAAQEKAVRTYRSSYSLGTSSSGISCVVTSASSASGACSTPLTTSASNACPSSASSSTLSESASASRDNPAISPDWPATLPPRPFRSSTTGLTISLLPRIVLFLRASFLVRAGFVARSDFLARFCFFLFALFLWVDFFLGMWEVYHRRIPQTKVANVTHRISESEFSKSDPASLIKHSGRFKRTGREENLRITQGSLHDGLRDCL